MKPIIKIFFFTLMFALHSTSAAAQSSSTVCGTLTISDRNYKNLPSKRQRIPSLPIAYTISQEEGLQIMSSSISVEDIIEFEICEIESTDCVFSFSDEPTFIQTLFTLQGEYQIRLITSNDELIGDISF